MGIRVRIFFGIWLMAASPSGDTVAQSQSAADLAAIERTWKRGETLPLEVSARFPLPEQKVRGDTGINVLIDLAHQCAFITLWRLPATLKEEGFRACGSQATLDTVLTPGSPGRVRIPVGSCYPFAWWPTARFNVVITMQTAMKSQQYLPEEMEALQRFVEAGGGLIIIPGRAPAEEGVEQWTLNKLAAQFGGGFLSRKARSSAGRVPCLRLDESWEVLEQGENSQPIRARRTWGEGRVVLLESIKSIVADRKAPESDKAETRRRMKETVKWVAAGSEFVGGEPRLPDAMAGGGGIYPELEQRVGGMVVYYARNQHEHLLKTVRDDLPAVTEQLQRWLPSQAPEEPMFLILSAGGGGGWAVNAYRPKEVGVISLDRLGVISIFAHEQAHTMGGPPNAKGTLAGRAPHRNQGEAHAGWFQGKITAMYRGVTDKPVKDCNRLFEFDKNADALDLAAEYENERLRKKWGKGKDWTKMWWVWQKLDDRYGPTWYPRWRWVQHTRWQDQPDRRLTWDEMVEDMSIAVGEDLFPFFHKIGTTLQNERLPRIEFMGETLELPVAPLRIGPAGNVRLDAIGDHKRPLQPRAPLPLP